MARSRVRVKDTGYRRYVARVSKMLETALRVGVFGDKAAASASGGELTIGELAEIHEFGRGHNPERSWLRAYFAENEGRLQQMVKRVALVVAAGRMTQRDALDLLGQQIVGEMKARIVRHIPPPLAASTVAAKGGKDTPLVNTGQFIGSIDHVVTGRA